ncbi:LOW QUALITY PROTEIN: uncharacterized protein LOC114725515 [Neltuma alba]|uniref:LOW QUALITY PROTEIN: uncharacterized protein LOC114725515 n=1 Tax=Neltuma alba TaxID=207710 RepID=UPI0010A579AC|nr:LOW QUALITY PROTEIN: uncharacterized protein LOC114725515 [Prosopis alba]
MGTPPPAAIGTRGTVGSLVRKEIEYFTMFELETRLLFQRQQPRAQAVDQVSARGFSSCRPSFWVSLMTWKRKKRKFSSGFLPKICSVSEVAETHHLDRIPGFSYRILSTDINNFGDCKDCVI